VELFACTEVVPGCTARFVAASEVEILRQVTAHAWRAHDLAMPHLPARTTRQVLAAVQHVDVVVEHVDLTVQPVVRPVAQPAA
jgi:predicted small metal-binding protein